MAVQWEIRGTELVCSERQHRLRRSRKAVPVLEVIFEVDEVADQRCNVFVNTTQGKELIGAIDATSLWIGSRDIVSLEDGTWGRPFKSATLEESSEEAKTKYREQWEGTHVFVIPTLPLQLKEGDIQVVGGDEIHIRGWLGQSQVWMNSAVRITSISPIDLNALNVAFVMAGYAMELAFKALAWTEGVRIEPRHEIAYLYNKLDSQVKAKVASISKYAGWDSVSDLISYIDDYLNLDHRRYFGLNKTLEFEALNISRDHRLSDLRTVHELSLIHI